MSDEDKDILKKAYQDFFKKEGNTKPGIVKRFDSKRNIVLLISSDIAQDGYFVLKIFRGKDRYIRKKKEAFFLGSLDRAKIEVPELVFDSSDYMILEYLGEKNLLDLLEVPQKGMSYLDLLGFFKKALDIIFDFGSTYNKTQKRPYILYDINLRNFLIRGQALARIDFESCRTGLIEEDLGRFLAYLVTYYPIFDGIKKRLFKDLYRDIFSRKTQVKKDRLISEIKDELKSIRDRRGIKEDLACLLDGLIASV